MVTLTLAHPLNAQQAERLHAKDVKDYTPRDKIIVPVGDAISIINAGFAAVDPDNPDAVQSALKGKSTSSDSSKDTKAK